MTEIYWFSSPRSPEINCTGIGDTRFPVEGIHPEIGEALERGEPRDDYGPGYLKITLNWKDRVFNSKGQGFTPDMIQDSYETLCSESIFRILDWSCQICHEENPRLFSVHKRVWDLCEVRFRRQVLCIACFQEQLGRPLTLDDFTSDHTNDLLKFGYHMTTNLRSQQITAIKEFHRQRRMFVLFGCEIHVAPAGDSRCHADWIQDVFGVDLNHDPKLRGYFDATGLYFYKDANFQATDHDWEEFRTYLANFAVLYDLDGNLPVHQGLIMGMPGERWLPYKTLGILQDLIHEQTSGRLSP